MPKKLFMCEKCGSIHQSETNAEQCENKHLKPTKQELIYTSKDRKSEYPQEVKLWFDMQCVTYTRDK